MRLTIFTLYWLRAVLGGAPRPISYIQNNKSDCHRWGFRLPFLEVTGVIAEGYRSRSQGTGHRYALTGPRVDVELRSDTRRRPPVVNRSTERVFQKRKYLCLATVLSCRVLLICLSPATLLLASSHYAPVLVVIVSRPWPWGPSSRCRSRNANRTPRKPRQEKIHIPR